VPARQVKKATHRAGSAGTAGTFLAIPLFSRLVGMGYTVGHRGGAQLM